MRENTNKSKNFRRPVTTAQLWFLVCELLQNINLELVKYVRVIGNNTVKEKSCAQNYRIIYVRRLAALSALHSGI